MTLGALPRVRVVRVLVFLASAAVSAACYTSGPHPVPGVRFEGVDYRELFMRGLVVPEAELRSIGAIEGTTGGIQIAVPTVYTATGLDPSQVILVNIPPSEENPAVLDAFVSSMVDTGNKPWPEALCRYLKPGWVDPGVPLPCAAPAEIVFGGTTYLDSGWPFTFGDGDLTPLGPFTFSSDLPADGLGRTAYRIADLIPEHAIAVAQGPYTHRVYLAPETGFFTELCPYMAVSYKACISDVVPGASS